ncbi:MAG: GguC family protein [Cyclobacteriaceae bacterium]
MKLIQLLDQHQQPRVGIVNQDRIQLLREVASVYELAQRSEESQQEMTSLAEQFASDTYLSYQQLAQEKRILLPFHHPDPYHTWITGTGLTHLGSASSRSAMHQLEKAQEENKLTDSMKMFQMGIENGHMEGDAPATQPEWFYKGNGLSAVASGQPLPSPAFALDGGEEPEIAGLYMISQRGEPRRIGFALGNEFSDHQMEKINYLYLAHSKLRKCSYGPEILIGDLPNHITGQSKIYRNQQLLWEKDFLTGEAHMSHNLKNLEYHHFKYELFRQPGDVHVHFFGTSVLSFADQVQTQAGDVFEISADCFEHPLTNDLIQEE